jgi:hypothetical protein
MWPRLLTVAVGIWLMAAPAVLGYAGTPATSDRIAGPVVAAIGIVAASTVTRGRSAGRRGAQGPGQGGELVGQAGPAADQDDLVAIAVLEPDLDVLAGVGGQVGHGQRGRMVRALVKAEGDAGMHDRPRIRRGPGPAAAIIGLSGA